MLAFHRFDDGRNSRIKGAAITGTPPHRSEDDEGSYLSKRKIDEGDKGN